MSKFVDHEINFVDQKCLNLYFSITSLLNFLDSLLATKNLSSGGYPESTTPTTPVSTTSYTETSRATNPTPISKNKMKNNFEPPGVNSIGELKKMLQVKVILTP